MKALYRNLFGSKIMTLWCAREWKAENFARVGKVWFSPLNFKPISLHLTQEALDKCLLKEWKWLEVLRRETLSIVCRLEKLLTCFVIWLVVLTMLSLSRHSTFPKDESYSHCLPPGYHWQWEMMMLHFHHYKPDRANINPKEKKSQFCVALIMLLLINTLILYNVQLKRVLQ